MKELWKSLAALCDALTSLVKATTEMIEEDNNKG